MKKLNVNSILKKASLFEKIALSEEDFGEIRQMFINSKRQAFASILKEQAVEACKTAFTAVEKVAPKLLENVATAQEKISQFRPSVEQERMSDGSWRVWWTGFELIDSAEQMLDSVINKLKPSFSAPSSDEELAMKKVAEAKFAAHHVKAALETDLTHWKGSSPEMDNWIFSFYESEFDAYKASKSKDSTDKSKDDVSTVMPVDYVSSKKPVTDKSKYPYISTEKQELLNWYNDETGGLLFDAPLDVDGILGPRTQKAIEMSKKQINLSDKKISDDEDLFNAIKERKSMSASTRAPYVSFEESLEGPSTSLSRKKQ